MMEGAVRCSPVKGLQQYMSSLAGGEPWRSQGGVAGAVSGSGQSCSSKEGLGWL